ncbi:MFS transporter [Parasulfitobacter algicola]|uniref:MFS transporter n=1 Tax=Parasulfitobacter algicola TaxID=2614809 RepID=A0ABX2IZQ3_9RHOB|nr:MFS transporter [Sulfitobacter algicola]NSX55868.1 MFS transporter [Sulfitobacter algicola]
MIQVLRSSWALLLGVMLLMVGNGLQSSLLGIRGPAAGLSTFEMSIIMSSYFLGFLGGSKLAPEMIRRVGHVRVFAALGSFISAVLILYPTLPYLASWSLGRVIIGFCFSGVYVTAESWLNNAVTNENRGKALSLYMIVQMAGVVAAQGLLILPDNSGYLLFVIPSVLVSISFAPILLSISPTPAFDTSKPMTIRKLIKTSPLGCMGMFLLGGVFAAQFGMSAVYGTLSGLSLTQISILVSTFYIGALVLQYPIGWISDRVDRRKLIFVISAIGGFGGCVGFMFGGYYPLLLTSAFLIGGTSTPLYALLIAYTNDFLEYEDMAAASGGLIFINGLGAIAGPLITGWMMQVIGPEGFFAYVALLMIGMAGYAIYRMTQRASSITIEETTSYAQITPGASPVAVEVAQEVFIETSLEDEISENETQA